MSKPIEKMTPAEQADELELKHVPPEGDDVTGGGPLPSTIAGGGGQGAIAVTDKSEA